MKLIHAPFTPKQREESIRHLMRKGLRMRDNETGEIIQSAPMTRKQAEKIVAQLEGKR